MSRCESISLCCVLLSYLNVCPFFPYIEKVFTVPSDLCFLYVEDTILIDSHFLKWLYSEYEPSLCSVLPATYFVSPKKWQNNVFSLTINRASSC